MYISKEYFDQNQSEFLGSARTSTFILLEELFKRGYKVEMPFWPNRVLRFTSTDGRTRLTNGVMNWRTPAIARMLSGNKLMTYVLAEELGLPTVELEVYRGKEQVLDFWNRFDGKCILKTVRGQGGSGVHMYFQGPEDYITQAERLSTEGTLLLQAWSSSSVDVRLLLIGGKFVAATIREPFYLEGDGVSSIGDLIEKENGQRLTHNKQHHFSMAKTFLSLPNVKKRTGFGGEHVLASADKLQCTLANISSGGIARDVTDTVHADFIESSAKLGEALNCPLLAVDFLCKDPTIGFTDGSTGTLFLETNTSPGIDLHQYPHVGQGRDVASSYIDYLLDFCDR